MPSGISVVTNLAIQQATGDYVVFLDHDDRLSLEALSLIAREVLAEPSVDTCIQIGICCRNRAIVTCIYLSRIGRRKCFCPANYIFHLDVL